MNRRALWLIHLSLLALNLLLLSRPFGTAVLAQQDQPGARGGALIEGTFQMTGLTAEMRQYELVELDPGNPGQIQAALMNRLQGRRDARIEDSWLDPNRVNNIGFRQYFVISWVP